LIDFKKELDQKAAGNQKEEEGGGFGGGFGGGNNAGKSTSAKKHMDQLKSNEEANRLAIMEGLKPLWHNKEFMSPVMKQIVLANEIKLKFEQRQLMKMIEEKVKLFDAELKVIRHEKARISIFMKNADLRHVTIFEEFLLLKDFEKTENELEQKQKKRKEDHLEVQIQYKELQRKMESKRKEIDSLDLKQKQLLETYNNLTHEEVKYSDFLYKVFKRKIKRRKKIDGEEEDEGIYSLYFQNFIIKNTSNSHLF
jgi:hypothetical protein